MRYRSLRNWHAIGWLVLFILAAVFSVAAHAQTAPTMSFSLQATSSDGKTVVPKLTWSTTPAATSCAASNGWTGTKAASGTETLAAVSSSKVYTLTCTWPGDTTAKVSWTAPTTNTDGSAYTDGAGYRIQYGRAADNLDQSVYIEDPLARSWTSPVLAAGQWFFGVRAYNAMGLEGALSNVASKTITAATNQSRTLNLGITIPSATTATVQ